MPPRSGHTAHLLPYDGGLGLLVLGGRRYEPPAVVWRDGTHYGRDDAYWIRVFDDADDVARRFAEGRAAASSTTSGRAGPAAPGEDAPRDAAARRVEAERHAEQRAPDHAPGEVVRLA